ncbi:hypothetical protein LZ30DRAFT_137078 [Colletotrichum cereale]|nr:hypothetical protein LZ30DRAFT_137078 [Colletotrichum cereale]
MTNASQGKGAQWHAFVRTIMMMRPRLLVPGRLVRLLEQGALETIIPSSALQSRTGSQDSFRRKSGSAPWRCKDKKRFLFPFLASYFSRKKSWSASRYSYSPRPRWLSTLCRTLRRVPRQSPRGCTYEPYLQSIYSASRHAGSWPHSTCLQQRRGGGEESIGKITTWVISAKLYYYRCSLRSISHAPRSPRPW